MKIKKVSAVIKNIYEDNLTADFRYPENLKSKIPLVVFCHGFKGFKDWGCFPYMLERISEENYFCVSFNFSYNGVGEDESEQKDFTRLDLFAKNTFSRELDDLGSVIDFLFEHEDEYNYDVNDFTLIGHSRGGGIAILKTAEDSRIKKLIVLASVNTFNRYSDVLKSKWKEAGFFEVLNARTNQMMRLNYSLIEDLEKNPQRLNIQNAIANIKVPVLFIHGTQDITVDYSNSEDLYSRLKENNPDKINKLELALIENTGHTFGAVHPYQGTTKALEHAIDLVLDFLKNK